MVGLQCSCCWRSGGFLGWLSYQCPISPTLLLDYIHLHSEGINDGFQFECLGVYWSAWWTSNWICLQNYSLGKCIKLPLLISSFLSRLEIWRGWNIHDVEMNITRETGLSKHYNNNFWLSRSQCCMLCVISSMVYQASHWSSLPTWPGVRTNERPVRCAEAGGWCRSL